jgi:predicted secreted protein
VIRLRPGEEHPVRLPSLGPAGYNWVPRVEGDDAVAEVEPGPREPPSTNAVGAGGHELFTVRALRPGATEIRFEQRRPWEPDAQPPANEQVLELDVSED